MAILIDFEKWKTTASSNTLKRPKDASNQSYTDTSDLDVSSNPRPIGNKKQKALAELDLKADKWIEKIIEANNNNETTESILKMMNDNMEQSKKNRESLENVFAVQSEKLALELKRDNALQALASFDLTTMPAEFQTAAKQQLQDEFHSILNFREL